MEFWLGDVAGATVFLLEAWDFLLSLVVLLFLAAVVVFLPEPLLPRPGLLGGLFPALGFCFVALVLVAPIADTVLYL